MDHKRASVPRPGETCRREFVRQSAVATAGIALWTSAQALLPCPVVKAEETEKTKSATSIPENGRPRLKSKSLFVAAPRPKTAIWVNTFYTRDQGLEMACDLGTETRSDTLDTQQRRFSSDNGRTWSDWESIELIRKTPNGVHRLYAQPGWVEPRTGRLLTMVLEGTLPTDNPLEGMKHWALRYRVSTDGGNTYAVDERVIQQGDYTPEHPLDGVWVGKNAFMLGATASRPICTRGRRILVPVQITPLGPDGQYHNPGGGYTYHEAAVLIGTWTDGLKIAWNVSERVANDPAKSTRGCVEPTLAEMPDRRILMVMRGSNDVKPHLPGRKWYCVSEDGGHHWSVPKAWTYTDGSQFFSPSSCSQLLKHSHGRCYWIGNITPTNPRGNSPRYPLVIGEVDPGSLMLKKDTIAVIDTRGPDDHPDLQLSNFLAYEDRENGEIVVNVTRFLSKGLANWDGDAYACRIALHSADCS